ncbi:hypothetical protein VHN57_02050 [Sphingobium sp. WW5]|uniref:hypothetical protein n=1 Tax=unclassified Sphingobium TaxID=2611147 RepID=UPI003C2AA4C2
MAVLSKGAIFAAAPATVEVEISEWGGSVMVKAYSLIDRVALMDAATENAHAVELYQRDQALDEDDREGLAEVKLYDAAILEIIHSCVDEMGARLFDLADHDRIRALSYASLQSIMIAVRQINTVPDQAALKKSSD